MDTYKKINLTEDTIGYFKDCFDKNGSPKSLDKIHWQFLGNPNGRPIVQMAISQADETAGIYAVYGNTFKLDTKKILGVQSLDTMTDANHRGKGLFITLANDVYNKSIEEQVGLVYGFPNGNSIYGFKKKLNWAILDPVPFLIKPLRTKYFTQKIKALSFLPDIKIPTFNIGKRRGIVIKEENLLPEEYNAIWDEFSSDIKVTLNRDKDYLSWRYLEKPGENYRIKQAYDEKGKYLGIVIYTIKEKHNGKIGYIMELIYSINNPNCGKALLNAAIQDIRKEKADCILSWCLEHSPNYNIYKSRTFIKMPEKLKPIELHFGARAFDKKHKDLVEDRKNWYLSYSDSDTV